LVKPKENSVLRLFFMTENSKNQISTGYSKSSIKGPETFTDCPDFKVWKIVKSFREGTSQPVHVNTE
jgi:hypothetical protein